MQIKDLIAKVRELVEASPNNKYNRPEDFPRCCYSKGVCDNGSVGCIFGQALRLLGEEIDPEWDQSNKSITIILADEYDVKYRHERCWCNVLQISQDQGLIWQQSLELADGSFPLDKVGP